MPDFFEDRRFVPADPQDLWGSESGQRIVARASNQFRASHPFNDLVAFGGGALIVPEDRRAQYAAFGVQ